MLTWQADLKSCVIRYIIANGDVDPERVLPVSERILVLTHMRDCAPDIAWSTFQPYPWTDTGDTSGEHFCAHEAEGLRATVTCQCGTVQEQLWQLRRFSYAGIMAALLN